MDMLNDYVKQFVCALAETPEQPGGETIDGTLDFINYYINSNTEKQLNSMLESGTLTETEHKFFTSFKALQENNRYPALSIDRKSKLNMTEFLTKLTEKQ